MHNIKFAISTNFNTSIKAQLNSETPHGYKQVLLVLHANMSARQLRMWSDCKILQTNIC
jgi:hypothetical protein